MKIENTLLKSKTNIILIIKTKELVSNEFGNFHKRTCKKNIEAKLWSFLSACWKCINR